MASITQNALDKKEPVIIPVHESKTMKIELTSWISKSIVIMNESKSEKIMHCWRKTGLLEPFEASPERKTQLITEAHSKKFELFPNLSNQDERDDGEVNSDDDQERFYFIGDVDVETVDAVTELELEQEDVAAQVDLVNTLLINAAAGSDKSTDIDLSKSKWLLDSVDDMEGTNDGGWVGDGAEPTAEQAETGDLLIHYAMF